MQDYSQDIIHSGKIYSCVKLKNYIITGCKNKIKVFDLNMSLEKPIQKLKAIDGIIFCCALIENE